jgi:hypothetical protein
LRAFAYRGDRVRASCLTRTVVDFTGTQDSTVVTIRSKRLFEQEGGLRRPSVVLATAGKADVAERSNIIVTADPAPGGARLQAWTPGAGFTDTVPVYVLMAVLDRDRMARLEQV